jgi:hypothetical protein
MPDPRMNPTVQVVPRDNNNSTDPNADQTNPWFDRPEPVDTAERAPQRDPGQVTGVPMEGEPMPKRPESEPSGEQTLLNWIPGKKAPLN